MQLLNEAKFVLLDTKERQNLDERLVDNDVYERNALPLLCSICMNAKSRVGSKCLRGMGHISPLIEEFNAALKEYNCGIQKSPDRDEFLNDLEEVLKKFITIDLPRLYPLMENRKKRPNSTETAFAAPANLGTCVSASPINTQKSSAPSAKAVVKILNQSLVRPPKKKVPAHPPATEIPMYDLSSLSDSELNQVLQYFGFQNVEPFSKNSAIKQLSSIIPTCAVEFRKCGGDQIGSRYLCHQCGRRRFPFLSFSISFGTCFSCKSTFCSDCLSNVKRKITTSGSYNLRTICKTCQTTFNLREAATWRVQGQFLLATDKKYLEAVLATYDLFNELNPSEMVFIMQSWALFYCNKHERLVRHVKEVLLTTNLSRESAKELQKLVAESLTKIADDADDSDLLKKADKYQEAIQYAAQFSDECGNTFHELKVEAMSGRLRCFEVHERVTKERIGKLLSYLIAAIKDGSLEKIFILLQDIDEDDKNVCLNHLSKEKLETYSQYGKLLLLLAKTTLKFKKDPTGAVGQIADIFWTGYSLFLENGNKEYILHYVIHFACQLLKGSHSLLLDALQEITPTNFLQCLHLVEEDILVPPDIEARWWTALNAEGCDMKMFLEYELAVKKLMETKKWPPVKVAFFYYDLIPACKTPSQLLVTLITSAQWFSKQMSLPDSDGALQYSCKKMILKLTNLAAAWSFELGANPQVQYYVARMTLGLQFYASSTAPCGNQDEVEMIREKLNWLVAAGRLCPLHKMPVVSPAESEILGKTSKEIYSEYLLRLQDELPPMRPMSEAILRYHIYENNWLGRCELQDGDGLRLTAMTELLHEEDSSWDDVQQLRQWNLVPLDSKGWLISGEHLLEPVASSGIHQIVGLEINKKDNSIQLLKRDGNWLFPSLLCPEDIAVGLAMGSQGFAFSLDPVTPQETPFHPFNKMVFMPQQLQESRCLNTLFHADYLLKQFSTGFEISLYPPFRMRPVHKGLLKDLPKKLQKALLSVPSRGPSCNRIHRFWIQADTVEYDVEENDDSIRWLFGDVNLNVRCMPMIHTPDGQLQDQDVIGSDPDSPEARFVADFNKHYDQIGEHFLSFLRLKELCKVQCLEDFVASFERRLEEKGRRLESKKMDAKFAEMHASIVQEQIKWEKELSNLRSYISDISALQEFLKKEYSVSDIEIDNWMRSGDSSAIAQRTALQSAPSVLKPILQEICEHAVKLEDYRRKLSTLMEKCKKCLPTTELANGCCWVPAVCHFKKGNLIYGGVELIPKLRKVTVRKKSNFNRVPLTSSFFGFRETVNQPPVKRFNPPRTDGRKVYVPNGVGLPTGLPIDDYGGSSSSSDSESYESWCNFSGGGNFLNHNREPNVSIFPVTTAPATNQNDILERINIFALLL